MDPRKFLTNSDYKAPYMVYYREFSFVVDDGYLPEQLVPHGLPFTPMIIGVWWTSLDTNKVYNIAMDLPEYSTGMPLLQGKVSADGTNLLFDLYNNTETASVTFYFKISAYCPIEYTGEVQMIQPPIGDFIINTDTDNNLKIFKEGFVNQVAPVIINHGLGYVPQCKVWSDNGASPNPGQFYMKGAVADYMEGGSPYQNGVEIDEQNLYLYDTGYGDAIYYYQIYADGVD